MTNPQDSLAYYEERYECLGCWIAAPGVRYTLGSKEHRVCRFCGKTRPEVTFRKDAHVIPQALGNRSILSYYECDVCNESFGNGIENDLGNWSKPIRTMLRISGQNGVPTSKKPGQDPGWRVEGGPESLEITAYEEDPIFEVDEELKKVKVTLTRDPYTPVGVLKAFVRIGLTLMPESELAAFPDILAWIMSRDHANSPFNALSIVHSGVSGPMPNDRIAAVLMRRKPTFSGGYFSFLSLTYGNESFQVPLFSEQYDSHLNNSSWKEPPFPAIWETRERAQKTQRSILDLSGRNVTRDESFSVTFSFDNFSRLNTPG